MQGSGLGMSSRAELHAWISEESPTRARGGRRGQWGVVLVSVGACHIEIGLIRSYACRGGRIKGLPAAESSSDLHIRRRNPLGMPRLLFGFLH